MPDDLNATLVKQLAARAGVPADGEAAELLTRLGEQDPKVALIASYLARRQELDATPTQAADDLGATVAAVVDDPTEPGAGAERAERAFRRLRQRVQHLYAEMEELRERDDALAAALGACHLCWGEEPGCPLCDGEGRPGAAPPDRRLFAQLVVPAIRAARPPRENRRPLATDGGTVEPAIDRL